MPTKTIETNYNGIVVDAATANDLKNDPSAEFLRFEQNPNGTYTVQAKIPEWGRAEGKDFHVRENINIFLRGLARSCLDENGIFDIEKANIVDKQLAQALLHRACPKDFLNTCEIPEDRYNEFIDFVEVCSTTLDKIRHQFSMEIDNLKRFQHNINKLKAEKGKASDAYKLVEASFDDYQNTLAQYTYMANMDPQTETGIHFATDCGDYAGRNADFLALNNAYRHKHKMPTNTGSCHTINYDPNLPEDPDNNIYLKFNAHHCFVLNTHVGGEPMVLSLEATAPPAGKLMFCPEKVRSGVGLYKNVMDLENFHYSSPYAEIPDMELFLNLKNIDDEVVEYVKKVERSDNFLTLRYDEAFAAMRAADKNIPPEQKEKDFESIENRVAREKAAGEVIAEMANVAIADKDAADIDGKRLSAKAMLGIYARRYAKSVNGDAKLGAILEKIKGYAEMNVSAVRGDYDKESAAYDSIYADVKAYFNELDAKQMGIKADPDKGIEEYDPETTINRSRYQIAADLFNYFEGQRDGNLAFAPQRTEKGAAYVDGTAYSITNHGSGKKFIDVSDQPLFPHEPCPNDINQGNLGDCYLLAGLSSLAEMAPQKIKDCIRDNKDGTVTVRFFTQKMNETTGESMGFQPIYVTVDKKIPEERGAESCLWVQMIERAYTASGLHKTPDKFAKPLPAKSELDAEYERISKLPPEERPSHTNCPWLIDTLGNLHRWTPDYADIEGGSSVSFLSRLLGEEVVEKKNSLKSIREFTDEFDMGDAAGCLAGGATMHILGNNATPEDERFALKSASYTSETVAQLLYRAFRPNEQFAYIDGVGFRGTDDNLTQACRFFASMVGNSTYNENNERPEIDGLSHAEIAAILRESAGKIQKLINDPNDPTVSFVVKENYNRFLTAANNVPGLLDFLRDQYVPAMIQYADVSAGRLAPAAPYSGIYTDAMLYNVYGIIKSNVDAGHPTTASPSGKSDRKKVGGIYSNHEYSVIDVTQRRLGGRDLKFIVLRNPHGKMGREYYAENGEIKFRENPNAPGGVFEVELGDFFKEFSSFDSACIGVDPPAANNNREPGELFVGSTASNYGRALSSIMSTLDTTGRDSAKYTELFQSLNILVANDHLSDFHGSTLKEIAEDPSMTKFARECTDYLEYCENHSHFFKSSRRDNRVFQAGNLNIILAAMKNNCKDPKDYLAKTFVEKMMDGSNAYASLSKEAKAQQINVFTESKQFQFMKNNMSFCDMVKLSQKPANEILKAWKTTAESFNKFMVKENEAFNKKQAAQRKSENKQVPKQSIL